MRVFFNGSAAAFAVLVASLVRQGVLFETKWFTDDDGLEGQAEIVFTGGF